MLVKNYKLKSKSYKYWVSRISNNLKQVCTRDYQLDKVEENQIINRIRSNKNILELGCGHGLLVEKLIKLKKIKNYIGVDLVKELIDIPKTKFKNNKKITFIQKDITLIDNKTFNQKFDYIISKRAIQNILSKKLQLETIDKSGFFLKKDGLMILIESSANAQKNINILRKKYGLHKIKPPFHNLFLNDDKIRKYKFKNLELKEIVNFSSNFYFITRIIYAYGAKYFLKEELNYNHFLNKVALRLNDEILKIDLSQIKAYIFIKK